MLQRAVYVKTLVDSSALLLSSFTMDPGNVFVEQDRDPRERRVCWPQVVWK